MGDCGGWGMGGDCCYQDCFQRDENGLELGSLEGCTTMVNLWKATELYIFKL